MWNIRYAPKFNQEQKRRIIYNFIWMHENSKTATNAAWLRTRDNNQAYLYEGTRNKLYNVNITDDEFTGYMWRMYGMNSSESDTRHIISMLRHGTMSMGLVRDVRRFAHWDRRSQTLYISAYDGTCYSMTGGHVLNGGVSRISNGAGPALFLDDDKGEPVEEPFLNNHGILFPALIDDLQYAETTVGGMSPAIQRTCLGIWIFAVAFPDLLPTKPLLLVEGMPGSGKTTSLKRIALALHGKIMPIQVPKQEDKDFGVKILRSPLCILDDVNELVEWFRDTVSSYATGAGWTKRALFTNDAEHVIKPESFLSITTNNPITFRQGQVADRCFILKLERRADNMGEDQLFTRVRSERENIFGEWLWWLNEIVKELRRNVRAETTNTRMADFAQLAHVIGRVLSRPRPGARPGPSGDWSPEAINEMLSAMQAERNALVVEGDALTDIIDMWLNTASNSGRALSINDLHRELSNVARQRNVMTFYKTPKSLAARLRETSDALADHFKIERKPGPNNMTMYTFERA